MDRTNAKRQRRYIARLKARAASVSKAAAKTAALQRKLARAEKRIAKMANEIAVREMLAAVSEEYLRDNLATADGGMDFVTMTAIAKALHPDYNPSETAASIPGR